MLTYVLKNVNYSNGSRVSNRVSNMYWMVAFKIHIMHHNLKKPHTEAVLKSGNHFYHGCFLQYFEGCPRVSSFHLNDMGNEIGNKL